MELEPAENVPALERGEVDLAIVADFGDGSLPSTPHLRSVPLTRDELMAVLPLGTHFTGLADLHDANWLLDGTELEQHVIRRCRRIGFEPRFAGRLFSHEALLYAVQRGLGVTILPSFVTAPPGTVQLRPLVPPAVRELLVLHREEALTRRSVALTLDVLVTGGRGTVSKRTGPRYGTLVEGDFYAELNIDYAALFSAVPSPCVIVTADLRICEVNPAYLDATGRRREDLIGRDLFDAFPDNPADPRADGERKVRASLERALRTGRPDTMAVQKYDIAVGPVFEERWWSVVNTPLKDADGQVALLLHTVEDVTAAQRAELALVHSERRFRSFVEHAADAILVIGSDGEVLYASPATSVITGRPIGETLGWSDLVHPDDVEAAIRLVGAARAGSGVAVSGRLRVLGGDGSLRYVDARVTDHRDDLAIGGLVINVRDVTAQQLAERTLQRQALEDALTATPNRRWFLEAAKHATARAQRNGTPLGVVLVDVDRFKLINDTMGHPAGDQLLIELTRRMAGALRPSDTVARLGGDEFAILSEDLRSEQDAWLIAQRVAEAATGLYDLGPGLEARVTLSIGLCTDDGSADADTLLAHADAALYKAKREGRNRIEVFDPELRRALVHRVRVEHELHRALRDGEFVLHWQPIIRTRDETIVGAEALLRWQHPERGLLAPAAFLPVAEEAGLMPSIGAWAIDRALAQAVRWQRMEERPRVFVNLAAEQLRVASLPDEVAQLALRYGVPSGGHLLRGERAEPGRRSRSPARATAPAARPRLRARARRLRRRQHGALVASAAAARRAQAGSPLHRDGRGPDRPGDHPGDRGPRSGLGVTTVAEGVESPAQLATLRRLGCDFAQGYEIAEPQSAHSVSQRFRRRVSLQP